MFVGTPRNAAAFCGFYVGSADAKLFNHASKVVMVRHENKTVISMMNDFSGDLTKFALVVPVPVVLQRGQIHIGDRKVFDHLDAYSAPRLVEYTDPDPCIRIMPMMMAPVASASRMARSQAAEDKAVGVQVEASYTIGEYDIVILSARESDGLEKWLVQNGYAIPPGASRALQPYIKQDMKFFVARVNLGEQAKTGVNYLRPLQFAFESPRFMLPIRLGMVNANGPQDLLLYVLTRDGRVETTDYRTEKMPTGMDVPESVKDEFGSFYKAAFAHQVEREQMSTVFTEYAWNMSWCDPCAAEPLSREELKSLGVFWLDYQPEATLGMSRSMPIPSFPAGGPLPVMLTRLHVRYTADTFPEDLVMQETQDQESFQARYVMHHPWSGSADACPAAREYFKQLDTRRREQAQTLADLTGWKVDEILHKEGLSGTNGGGAWWKTLWN